MKERYEQEIEQLLAELESRPPDDTNAPPTASGPASGADHRTRIAASPPADDRPSPFTPRPRSGPGLRLISPPKLALAGIALAAVGLLVPLPGLQMLAIAGLVIAGVAIGWMFLRRMMAQQSPAYWRGRPLDASSRADAPRSAWLRFRRWLAK